ncbi:MAG TPA: HsdR family type I site-specific deoxyribonuclease [Spirochaetota bacterium]|nr:HsdR family type I site-specific deoxyribonuclease [Spirochaetota bacterium]
MSEYQFVEKPFLEQLEALGWTIIEHNGIPKDPALSHREDFREILLKDIFIEYVKRINTDNKKHEWLTDKQLTEIYNGILDHPHKTLIEANRDVFSILLGGGENKIVMDNELTGESSVAIKLIDFENPGNNSFTAISQFRIDTPGTAKDFIIPDIVLFVNGMPLVVIECKYPTSVTANAMDEGIRQLMRYAGKRNEFEGITGKEGDERLFWFNQIIISTFGDTAKYASISAVAEDHFLEWKDIYPTNFREYNPPFGKERSQEVLIQGMLPPSTLLDIIRSFIIYREDEGKRLTKIICRYQQYRAVLKANERMLTGKTNFERSGVIWHTQGSGKSLTMVFLIRSMRYISGLSDYKILLVNDRIDLEVQLTDTARLTGETIYRVDSAASLKEKLAHEDSGVYMVMIHKFIEKDTNIPDYLKDILVNDSDEVKNYGKDDLLKDFKLLDEVNPSEKILILIDEAHRSQGNLMNLNMFNAFPNSTKIAFTGTPLITERHKKKTHDTFGTYIDKYKLQDAVNDGATLAIIYEGKTADAAINQKSEFDRKFEDLFKDRPAKELEAIKRKYGTLGDILEADKYIEEISKDLVKHYADYILPNGFKAQVVTNSQIAAVRYWKHIDSALEERLEIEKNKTPNNKSLISLLEMTKTAAVISGQGTNEDPDITRARKHAAKMNAIENFKKKFDVSKPETGMAVLIVCDMLLTGFDAPIEQVMYINKRLKEHNLLQAIARVNRTASGKQKGFIIDYIGIGNHLKEALEMYASDDRDDILNAMKDISTEIPVLQDRYQRLLNLFIDKGVSGIKDYVEFRIKDPKEQFDILEKAIEVLEDIKTRANFDIYLKNYLKSLDVILPHPIANDYILPAKAFGHIMNRARNRYKDDTISLTGIGNKVRNLIDEHLISLGINPVVAPVELLSKDFKISLDKNKSKKAAASEMEHAIRKHIKVQLDSDPAYYEKMSEKLDNILKNYHEDIDERYKALLSLFDEVKEGRKDGEAGLDLHKEMPFYDLMIKYAFGDNVAVKDEVKEQLISITQESVTLITQRIKLIDFWNRGPEQDSLKRDLQEVFLLSGVTELQTVENKLIPEFMALAKRKKDELAAD